MSKKLLFVCTANRFRSKTAEDIFKQDLRFEVKSAGTDIWAKTQINKMLLEWADYVFVMERVHKSIIHYKYPNIYKNKRIVCLHIQDIYNYIDQELVDILKMKIDNFFQNV
ncbi:MAG: arsenate reductase/protein-tyrosine-phosphatase family protein [Promethearchaeota archaeon]